jgi:hypothetical protein
MERLSAAMAVKEQLKRFSLSVKSCPKCGLSSEYTASFYGNLQFAIMDIIIMTDQTDTYPLCRARAESRVSLAFHRFQIEPISFQIAVLHVSKLKPNFILH